MAEKCCPRCERMVEDSSNRCPCGLAIPGPDYGWSEDLVHIETPWTVWGWVIIFSSFLLTLGLFTLLAMVDWFHLRNVATTLLLVLFVVCPLVCQYLPSLRLRNGGCCLGCLTWVAAALAVWLASVFWSFEDPVSTREVRPPPHYRHGVLLKVDGIHLGEPIETVLGRLGPGTPADYPFLAGTESQTLVWESGTAVTFSHGAVVAVRGTVLTQASRTLAEAGYPLKKLHALFERSTKLTSRQSYELPGARLLLAGTPDGKTRHISLSRSGSRMTFRAPKPTVDGIALGIHQTQLGEGVPEVGGWTRYGETRVWAKGGRVLAVQGTTLALNGERLIAAGDPAEKITGKCGRDYRRPADFESAKLRLFRDEESGRVSSILYSLSQ